MSQPQPQQKKVPIDQFLKDQMLAVNVAVSNVQQALNNLNTIFNQTIITAVNAIAKEREQQALYIKERAKAYAIEEEKRKNNEIPAKKEKNTKPS